MQVQAESGFEKPWAAVLLAGGTLALCELTHVLALRWYHAPTYYVLCVALSLVLAAGLGFVFTRLGVTLALVGWTAASALLVEGPLVALATGLGFLPLVFLARRRKITGAVQGVCAGAGLGIAFSVGPQIARTLGLDGELGTAAGAFALELLVATGLPLLVWPLTRRVGAGVAPAALFTAALLLSLQPLTNRPTGKMRLPRASDLEVPASETAKWRPHVFLIVLDTVRADHLSLEPYGYERETTPELARWVEERSGAVFEHAYSNGTWTVPSHASLLTGLRPEEHGAHFDKDDASLRFHFALPTDSPTLAERLQGSGYSTLGTFANNWLRLVGGMGDGFLRYFRTHPTEPMPFVGERLRHLLVPGLHSEVTKMGTRAADVNATLLSMVEPWSEGPRPLFAFANYGDPHGPYAPMPGFRGRFLDAGLREHTGHVSVDTPPARMQVLEARYDEEILYLDHQLGQLFTRLDELDVLGDSWVFITSDHGEAFGEHGVTEHGTTVYDEVVRVPLIVLPPDGQQIRPAPGPVSLIDVASTIAAIGGTHLDDASGRDLRTLETDETVARLEFYGDELKARIHGELARHPARVVVARGHKLIAIDGRFELYNIEADPGETNDLSADPEHLKLLKELREELPEFGSATRFEGNSGPSENDLRGLQELGYVGGDAP